MPTDRMSRARSAVKRERKFLQFAPSASDRMPDRTPRTFMSPITVWGIATPGRFREARTRKLRGKQLEQLNQLNAV